MTKTLRLLLVEDSALDAELLIAELQRAGYDVTSTRVQTAEAMNAALRDERWDAVVSDFSMPNFSGMGALQVLHATGQDLPFIIVSGTIGEETAVAALKAGAHDFLVKNKLARLVPALERELREVASRRDRARLEQQLRQAQKMEAIGHLAGGIAHDFNNILTTISGYSEMVLEQIGTDKPISGDLLEIQKASQRAAELTKQLLAFSRQQVIHISPIDINEVVRDIRGMLQRLIGEDITIELNLFDQRAVVSADRVQLEQVLMNVAANARDAMPNGGRLTIETAPATSDVVANITGLRIAPGAYFTLVVTDTGAGMDAATRDHLFEPFFTTKERGKGTGLGMATVYGIVKQLDGYVWVTSEPGRGTAFAFFFRASDVPTAEGAAHQPVRAVAPIASHREKVLVVEDEGALRTLVARTLTRHGYEVVAAESGAEALVRVSAIGFDIDLVLTDVVMPSMTGPELVAHILRERPRTKVLYMSGYVGRALDHATHNRSSMLAKPFSAHDLLSTVRQVLDDRLETSTTNG